MEVRRDLFEIMEEKDAPLLAETLFGMGWTIGSFLKSPLVVNVIEFWLDSGVVLWFEIFNLTWTLLEIMDTGMEPRREYV